MSQKAVSPAPSTRQEEQLVMSLPLPRDSSPNTSFEAITYMTGKTKQKCLRIDEGLLNMTEELRSRTGLDFSAYMREALIHFNGAYKQYLVQEEKVDNL